MPDDIDAFDAHDHGVCIASALEAADRVCAEQGLRLTPVRRKVLTILLEAHKAMGAYDVLERLEGAAPPVAYRALDFLTRHGFAHRIERLNAYVACVHPGSEHDPAFLICRSCNVVSETTTNQAQDFPATSGGFAIERTVVEAEGLCPACQVAPS